MAPFGACYLIFTDQVVGEIPAGDTVIKSLLSAGGKLPFCMFGKERKVHETGETLGYVSNLRTLAVHGSSEQVEPGKRMGPAFLEPLRRLWGDLRGEDPVLLSWSMEADKVYAELVALGEHSPLVGLSLTRERLEKVGRGRKQLSGEQRAQVLRDVIWWATFSLYTAEEDHSGAAFALLFVEERTRFMVPSRLRIWCMVRVSYHLQKGMGDTSWVSGAALEAAQEGYAFAELLGDFDFWARGCAGQTVHHRLSLGVVRALYGAAA